MSIKRWGRNAPVSYPQSFWYLRDMFLAFTLLSPSPVRRNVKYLTQKTVQVKRNGDCKWLCIEVLCVPLSSLWPVPTEAPFLSLCSSLVIVHQQLPCFVFFFTVTFFGLPSFWFYVGSYLFLYEWGNTFFPNQSKSFVAGVGSHVSLCSW